MQQTKDLGLTHKKDLTTLSTCGWYNYGIILPVTTVGDKGKLKVPKKFFISLWSSKESRIKTYKCIQYWNSTDLLENFQGCT